MDHASSKNVQLEVIQIIYLKMKNGIIIYCISIDYSRILDIVSCKCCFFNAQPLASSKNHPAENTFSFAIRGASWRRRSKKLKQIRDLEAQPISQSCWEGYLKGAFVSRCHVRFISYIYIHYLLIIQIIL